MHSPLLEKQRSSGRHVRLVRGGMDATGERLEPVTISLVRQQEKMGCGVACLAMLTGQDYGEVAAAFPGRCFSETGLTDLALRDYLAMRGIRFGDWRTKSGDWPPEPFGEVHLCSVHVYPWSPCDHWVVMLATGEVLDPLSPYPWRLSDYDAVNSVVAICRE